MEGELTTKRPPVPQPAAIPFERLEETTRHALLASPKVKASQEQLGKACSGGDASGDKKRCDRADKAFAQTVVDYVRSGGALPMPERRP
jgi:hypothetical protein